MNYTFDGADLRNKFNFLGLTNLTILKSPFRSLNAVALKMMSNMIFHFELT